MRFFRLFIENQSNIACPDLQKDRDKDTYNKDTIWEFEILRTDR